MHTKGVFSALRQRLRPQCDDSVAIMAGDGEELREAQMLALAEVRSEPILEVSAVIGSRHKSEHRQIALGGRFIFFLTSESKVLRQKFTLVHGSISLEVDRDDITPSPPHNEYLGAIFPARDTGDCLLVSKGEDTLFVSASGNSSTVLSKLHGFSVLSAVWLSAHTVRKHVVLGTSQGNVLEVVFSDLNCVPRDACIVRLLDLDPATPVLQLECEPFPAAPHLACVYMATRDGIYFLSGPKATGETQSLLPLFQKYKEDGNALRNAISAAPHPGETSYMQLFHKADGAAESFIFLSGSVVMYNTIPEKPESEGSCIVEIRSLPLPVTMKSPPQGCGISAHYLFLLYPDRLLVFSRLTLQLVSSSLLPFSGCYYRGIVYDSQMEAMIVWSNQVFVIHLQGEGRMQWVYLAEREKYEEALESCREHCPRMEPRAKSVYADALLSKGELRRAVELYIESDKPVEDVIAALSVHPLHFLSRYLESLYEDCPVDPHPKRTVLAHSLLSISLISKASKSDLVSLFRRYGKSLDFISAVQALQHAARVEELVEFCREKQAFQFLFHHYVNGLAYEEALKVLPACGVEDIARNLEETAAIFVQTYPVAFYSTLLQLVTTHSDFSIRALIPAIRSTPADFLRDSSKFLHLYIDTRRSSDPEIHNCYIHHLCLLRDQKELENYLSRQAKTYQRNLQFDFDPELALSLLQQSGLSRTQVTLLTHLFRFQEAVKKALDILELPLAEQTAARPTLLANQIQAEMKKVTILTQGKVRELAYLFPPDLIPRIFVQTPQRKDIQSIESLYRKWSKSLWLQVGKWHSLHGNDAAVLEIETKCPEIEFRDLVPMLTSKVQFGEIRGQVKTALKKYAEEVTKYKREAEVCRQKAEEIRKEHQKKSSECIQGDMTQPCALCSRPMSRENAFLFPCLHVFHESCLVTFYKENRVPGVSETVEGLIRRIKEAERPENLRKELLEVLSSDCCFCCDSYIEWISAPLACDEAQFEAWDLATSHPKCKMDYRSELDLESGSASADRVASLQEELDNLRKHVSGLEQKLRSPLRTAPAPAAKPPAKAKSTHSRKEKSSADQLIAEIQSSERELTKLQHSLSHSPGRIPNVAIARQVERMRNNLAEEKRRTARLESENASLKETLRKREALQSEISRLQEEYNALTVSFDRSEEIRRKQKKLIEELRRQLTSPADVPADSDCEPSDRQLQPPTLTVKRRKSKRK